MSDGFFGVNETDKAIEFYREERIAGGEPVLLCEHSVAESYPEFICLDLGATPEEMASNLYAHLRTGEKTATLLIGIEPRAKGGVMDGVRNRLLRAFGQDAKERTK